MKGKKLLRHAKKKVSAILDDASPSYLKVGIDQCAPNSWNPNVMDAEGRHKLLLGIKRVLRESGRIPPIVVRKHPDPAVADYQIIDGEHRWRVLKDDGEVSEIDAFVLDVNTKTAKVLTDTLNYLRGTPDAAKYGAYLRDLIEHEKMPVTEVASYLSQSADELQDLIESQNIDITHIEIKDDSASGEGDDDDQFMTLTFHLARGQAEIVEAEITRIASFLNGKNLRGRALEFMAVNSSQTELENLTGEAPQLPPPSKKKTVKEKLKKRMAA